MSDDSRSPRQGQDPPADPRDLADYSALDPLARHAWFLATLLMLRHWALGLVRRRADPADDPRDLVQEALAGALRDWQAFVPYPDTPPFYALRGWFAGVLLNKCRMARRFRRTRLEVPLAGAKDSSEALRHPGHGGQVEARSLLRALRAAVPPDLWRTWYWYEAEGRTAPEVAAIEGIREPTVYDRIRRARERFAAELARLAVVDAGPVVGRPTTPRRRPRRPRSKP